MPYATIDDLKAEIPARNLEDLTMNLVRIQKALDDATAEVDSFLGRYLLPLADPVPGIIRQTVIDIAVYRLYERRFELEMPQGMRTRYEDAIARLKRIEEGTQILNVTAIEESAAPGVLIGSTRKPIFGDEFLRRMP
jgi:phage gp36-like protein